MSRDAAQILRDTQALRLQLGLRSHEARALCEAAEVDYVEDACAAVVHRLEVL